MAIVDLPYAPSTNAPSLHSPSAERSHTTRNVHGAGQSEDGEGGQSRTTTGSSASPSAYSSSRQSTDTTARTATTAPVEPFSFRPPPPTPTFEAGQLFTARYSGPSHFTELFDSVRQAALAQNAGRAGEIEREERGTTVPNNAPGGTSRGSRAGEDEGQSEPKRRRTG
jgi:hypothetical protein